MALSSLQNIVREKKMTSDYNVIKKIEEAEQFIDKSFLDHLTEYKVQPLSEHDKNYRFVRLNKIEKIVYDADENINDKLISVYTAVAPFIGNIVMLVKGTSESAEIYIGIRSKNNVAIAQETLCDSFFANFPGSVLTKVPSNEVENILNPSVILSDKHDSTVSNCATVASINLIPSLRGKKDEKFVQGLEKFIDTMKGQEYLCEILASPLSNDEIIVRKNGFEQLYSALYPFSKKTMAHGHNEGRTLTEGINENFSNSISTGISLASGTSQSRTKGKNNGFNVGAHMLLNFGFMNSTSDASTGGMTYTSTDSETKTQQNSFGRNSSESVTRGTTDNISVEHRNKAIEDLLKKIDKHIERINDGAAYGLWECAAYFIAADKKTSSIAASSFKSLMLGDSTGAENTHMNLFGIEQDDRTAAVLETLSFCEHPRFTLPTVGEKGDNTVITPTNYINGKELPIFVNMPRKSISGINVSEMAEFGRNIHEISEVPERKFEIGNIYHMGKTEKTVVKLNADSLTSHCFITGSTGSGKSNTVYKFIEELIGHDFDIPFLIIEPAKGEYRKEFGGIENINIFTTNPTICEFLKINPFYFNPEIHILEHLDRLIEIFNACWEMYAAMPAILKDAIEQAYVKKGWDLLNSMYIKSGEPVYPTFRDLLDELPYIINKSGYSSDTKGDYIGALVTRVNSLTNGIYGQIFCNDFGIDDKTLFDSKTIIDLSRVGSTETKSLIMGMLVLKLSEYRMAQSNGSNLKLRHITILEEAHNLLKNTQNTQGTAGNNVVAKSVEMIVNSIAEMRTYGEGFIIVDQSPTSVDISAIKNTNTKIIMRLPEKDDCDLIGKSVSLRGTQISELAKLPTGVAVVMQNNWSDAVLAKIHPAGHKYNYSEPPVRLSTLKNFRKTIITELLNQYVLNDYKNVSAIINVIESFDISKYKKREMIRYIKAMCGSLNNEFNSILLGRNLMSIAACSDAFTMAERSLKIDEQGDFLPDTLYEWNKSIENDLDVYIELSRDCKDVLIQYILWARSFENHDISYSKLYNSIYNIK